MLLLSHRIHPDVDYSTDVIMEYSLDEEDLWDYSQTGRSAQRPA